MAHTTVTLSNGKVIRMLKPLKSRVLPPPPISMPGHFPGSTSEAIAWNFNTNFYPTT